ARLLQRDVEDVHRRHLQAVRPAEHRGCGRLERLGLSAALGGVHPQRESEPDRARRHALLWPERVVGLQPPRLVEGRRRSGPSRRRDRRLGRVTLGAAHRAVRAGRREGAPPALMRLAAAAVFLAAALLTGVLVGPVDLGALTVVHATFAHVFGLHSPLSGADDAILWQLRLPRVVLGALVGGTLAAAGAAYQGVFRNPLADPYLLGAAAGAGLGAT